MGSVLYGPRSYWLKCASPGIFGEQLNSAGFGCGFQAQNGENEALQSDASAGEGRQILGKNARHGLLPFARDALLRMGKQLESCGQQYGKHSIASITGSTHNQTCTYAERVRKSNFTSLEYPA